MKYLALILALAIPLPALATGSFTKCNGESLSGTPVVANFDSVCWVFDGDDDSTIVEVRAKTALVCFDPDITTDGAATAQVMINHCPTSNAVSAFTCMDITDSSSTGITGASGTQDSCIRVGTGFYYVDVTTADAGTDSRVSFRGEGN